MRESPQQLLPELTRQIRSLSLAKLCLDRETIARYRKLERHILAALANTKKDQPASSTKTTN